MIARIFQATREGGLEISKTSITLIKSTSPGIQERPYSRMLQALGCAWCACFCVYLHLECAVGRSLLDTRDPAGADKGREPGSRLKGIVAAQGRLHRELQLRLMERLQLKADHCG